jgi:hypothetical protein
MAWISCLVSSDLDGHVQGVLIVRLHHPESLRLKQQQHFHLVKPLSPINIYDAHNT